MGFFDKLKETVSSASKKVGSFMKNAFKESEEQAEERRKLEAEQKVIKEKELKAKADADAKALSEAEAKAKEEKALREEKVKQQLLKEEMEKANHKKKLESMSVKIDNEKKIDGEKLLSQIGAINDDKMYVAGISSLKDSSSMLKILKKDKDKVYLSCNDGYFYVSRYQAADKTFRVTKSFKREDVSSVVIETKTLEKKLEIKDKENFFIIRIDVTDNGNALQAFKDMLK